MENGLPSKHKGSIVIETMRDKIGREFNELFINDHKQLFDLIFNLIKSYRNLWNEQYLYPLIYELLFNILIECYIKIEKYEKIMSQTLCDQFNINKDILFESFYNQWIKNSNYQIFLHSTDEIQEIKTYLTDTIFGKNFIYKHLDLESHQISEEIHLKFAEFVEKCINISWKMCIQKPKWTFVPNRFNVEQINKEKYHQDLHSIYHGIDDDKKYEYILYYIWPIISYNKFHSIVNYMKMQVCLGDTLPNKGKGDDMKNDIINDDDDDGNNYYDEIESNGNINNNNNYNDNDDYDNDDEDESVGAMFVTHMHDGHDTYNNEYYDD